MTRKRRKQMGLALTILVACALGYAVGEFIDLATTAARWQAEGQLAFDLGRVEEKQAWWYRPPSLVALEVWVSCAANILAIAMGVVGGIARFVVWRRLNGED